MLGSALSTCLHRPETVPEQAHTDEISYTGEYCFMLLSAVFPVPAAAVTICLCKL